MRRSNPNDISNIMMLWIFVEFEFIEYLYRLCIVRCLGVLIELAAVGRTRLILS